MTKKGIETRRYVGMFLLVFAIFCSFGTFGAALSWASSPKGGGFYWVVTFVVAVAFVAGLISMYRHGKDFLDFYEDIVRRGLNENSAYNCARMKCDDHLRASKTFQKHWQRKTCTKN